MKDLITYRFFYIWILVLRFELEFMSSFLLLLIRRHTERDQTRAYDDWARRKTCSENAAEILSQREQQTNPSVSIYCVDIILSRQTMTGRFFVNYHRV